MTATTLCTLSPEAREVQHRTVSLAHAIAYRDQVYRDLEDAEAHVAAALIALEDAEAATKS